jgi:hypothetical protein
MMLIRILLLSVALLGGFFATDIVHWITQQSQAVSLDDYCLLSTNECRMDGNVTVVNKDTSQPLIATEIDVNWTSSDAESLIVTLQGYEMEMGVVKFSLTKTESGHFSGQMILPVCTMDAMTWYGTITDGSTSMNTAIRMER